MKEISVKLLADGLKFAIVVSRFNDFLTKQLVEGAKDCLIRHGASDNDITVIWVPGANEIPLVADKMAMSGNYNAVVALGALVHGRPPLSGLADRWRRNGCCHQSGETTRTAQDAQQHPGHADRAEAGRDQGGWQRGRAILADRPGTLDRENPAHSADSHPYIKTIHSPGSVTGAHCRSIGRRSSLRFPKSGSESQQSIERGANSGSYQSGCTGD